MVSPERFVLTRLYWIFVGLFFNLPFQLARIIANLEARLNNSFVSKVFIYMDLFWWTTNLETNLSLLIGLRLWIDPFVLWIIFSLTEDVENCDFCICFELLLIVLPGFYCSFFDTLHQKFMILLLDGSLCQQTEKILSKKPYLFAQQLLLALKSIDVGGS